MKIVWLIKMVLRVGKFIVRAFEAFENRIQILGNFSCGLANVTSSAHLIKCPRVSSFSPIQIRG